MEQKEIEEVLDKIKREMDEREAVEIRKRYDMFLKEKREIHAQFL